MIDTICSTLDIKMWIQLEFVWQSQMTEYIIGLEVWIILLFHQKKNPGMQMQFTTVVLNKQKNKLLMWYNGRKQNCERIGLAEYRIK